MSRAGERERDRDSEEDPATDLTALESDVSDPAGLAGEQEEATTAASTSTSTSTSTREGLRDRAGRLFSARALLVALVAVTTGFLLASTFIPLGSVAGLLGVVGGAFAHAAVAGRSRYAETAVAGGAVAGSGLLVDYLVLSAFAGIGAPLAAVGVGGGVLAALVGHYFGRDLRAGLTRSVE